MLTDFDQPRDRILWQIGSRKFPRPRDLLAFTTGVPHIDEGGGASKGLWFDYNQKGIRFERHDSHALLFQCTWTEVAHIIRPHLTPTVIADLHALNDRLKAMPALHVIGMGNDAYRARMDAWKVVDDEGKVYGLTVWAKAEPVEQLDLFGGAA